MNSEEVLVRLLEIIRMVFDNENIGVNMETVLEDIEDWNSLEQMNLFASIEDRFNIKFSIAEVMDIRTVGEIVNLIIGKI